jgi:hypothetical protein
MFSDVFEDRKESPMEIGPGSGANVVGNGCGAIPVT